MLNLNTIRPAMPSSVPVIILRALPVVLLSAVLAFKPVRAAQIGVWEGKTHVVYHLSDLSKVPFVLGNIRNHLREEAALTG
jgi:hypothetical protein